MNGDPFPTTYYLTCPHLVAAVSRLEAAGGVERWSAEVAQDEELRPTWRRRPRRNVGSATTLAGSRRGVDAGASLDWGIGGSRRPEQLKCMHAHVAFALANPGYRIGELMLAEVPERWPGDRCCTQGTRDERRSRRQPAASGRAASRRYGQALRETRPPRAARGPVRRSHGGAPPPGRRHLHAARARSRVRSTPTCGRCRRSRNRCPRPGGRAPCRWSATLPSTRTRAGRLTTPRERDSGSSTPGRDAARGRVASSWRRRSSSSSCSGSRSARRSTTAHRRPRPRPTCARSSR